MKSWAGSKIVRRNGSPMRRTRAEAIALLKINFTKNKGCHEWSGARTKAGYPIITFEGKTLYAHRLALEVKLGKLSSRSHALHRCDNPPCINPDHLFPGTQKINGQDMVSKGRNRNKTFPGSKNGFAVLTESIVKRMRKLKSSGLSYRKIGVRFGVRDTAVYYACKIGWKHVV